VYWGSGGITPRFLWPRHRRWMFSFTPRPLYPQGKSPWCPLDRKLGAPQSRSGHGGEEKNSQLPPGIEPQKPDRPARSPALYRLSYHGSCQHEWTMWNYSKSATGTGTGTGTSHNWPNEPTLSYSDKIRTDYRPHIMLINQENAQVFSYWHY
jgi:hypothetical protein